MASNKYNAKSKSKEDKIKGNKAGNQTAEDDVEVDFSLLRKPISNSITGFAQAKRIFDVATEELKGLISEECDVLYECKVCRNIFRSLVNFISHKRIFCKEKFNSSVHGHFAEVSSLSSELLKLKQIEEGYQDSLRANIQVNRDLDDRVPLTKDLTSIVEILTKNRGVSYTKLQDSLRQVSLQRIPASNNAVFQNGPEESISDNMHTQVTELDSILSKDMAVLQKDGKFTIQSSLTPVSMDPAADGDSVIQISDDEEDSTSLRCKLCDLQFSTQKTLKFHMKNKHLESRLVYPCPDCVDIFSTSWGVFRHLFKVHRKSAAQIRRMRESIQSKAFRMNNPPASYEKKKNSLKSASVQKVTEVERMEQENQAWMDNMEGDEVPRCGGCGRMFERRAALAAHTYTCQPRNRALARRPETKKIEIQIRKDYNKGGNTLAAKANDAASTKSANENNSQGNPTPMEVSDGTQLIETVSADVADSSDEDNKQVDVDELKDDDRSDNKDPLDTSDPLNDDIKLPFSEYVQQKNIEAFKKKMEPDIDLDVMLCKKCNSTCVDINSLHEHMAEHYKWYRFGCKLCNFKHYTLSHLPEHIREVHKLRGDHEFYRSTVKALEATEAMECCETNERSGTSPESRRPSRCSSDSSRLSDNESSSSTSRETPVNIRKRKLIPTQGGRTKKKKNATPTKIDKKIEESAGDNNMLGSEENSSDLDELEDKIMKKQNIDEETTLVLRTTGRPVRKRSKPKYDDFEYDLSNLLKMEAQGYRDSQQVTTTRTTVPKKKVVNESIIVTEVTNKNCKGALLTLSKRATVNGRAHLRQTHSQTQRSSSVFAKPLIPKLSSVKVIPESVSPVKETKEVMTAKNDLNVNLENDDKFNKTSTPVKVNVESCIDEMNEPEDNDQKEEIIKSNGNLENETSSCDHKSDGNIDNDDFDDSPKIVNTASEKTVKNNVSLEDNFNLAVNDDKRDANNKDIVESKMKVPTVVPLKLHKQSLELIKPIINKNISDFSKAGMKTKIVLIKPLNRNKAGVKHINAPIKFQTIKLKDKDGSINKNDSKNAESIKVVKYHSPQNVPEQTSMSETDKDSENSANDINKTNTQDSGDTSNCNNHVTINEES